jgi:hypothetical protein
MICNYKLRSKSCSSISCNEQIGKRQTTPCATSAFVDSVPEGVCMGCVSVSESVSRPVLEHRSVKKRSVASKLTRSIVSLKTHFRRFLESWSHTLRFGV